MVFDAVKHSFDLIGRNRTLLGCSKDTLSNLVAVLGLSGTILLDNQNGQTFNLLISGEALAAVKTLPPPSYGGTLICWSGVDYLVFLAGTIRTFHMVRPPFILLYQG